MEKKNPKKNSEVFRWKWKTLVRNSRITIRISVEKHKCLPLKTEDPNKKKNLQQKTIE